MEVKSRDKLVRKSRPILSTGFCANPKFIFVYIFAFPRLRNHFLKKLPLAYGFNRVSFPTQAFFFFWKLEDHLPNLRGFWLKIPRIKLIGRPTAGKHQSLCGDINAFFLFHTANNRSLIKNTDSYCHKFYLALFLSLERDFDTEGFLAGAVYIPLLLFYLKPPVLLWFETSDC